MLLLLLTHARWCDDDDDAHRAIFIPKVLVPIFAWVIGFPLSMIKNIELFSIPSTLSQFGIFYSVGIVAYFGYSNISGNQQSPGYGTLSAANWDLEAITAIPLICFSYQCHVTFPLVYASMKGKSMSKMRIVNIVCIVGCMLIYLLIGSGGYVAVADHDTTTKTKTKQHTHMIPA